MARRKKQVVENKTVPFTVFNSTEAFRIAYENEGFEDNETFDDEWCGGSRDAALRLLKTGDVSKVADAEKKSAAVSDLLAVSNFSETCHDVAGFAPDVPAFLAGVPENMITRCACDSVRGDVIVAASIRASSKVTAREMELRGVCVLAAVIAIQKVRNVKMVVYAPEEFFATLVKLSYPFDVSEVCAFLCNPVIFRRCCLEPAAKVAYSRGCYGINVARWCDGDIQERAEIRRAMGLADSDPLVMLANDKIGAWSRSDDGFFMAEINEIIEKLNKGNVDL